MEHRQNVLFATRIQDKYLSRQTNTLHVRKAQPTSAKLLYFPFISVQTVQFFFVFALSSVSISPPPTPLTLLCSYVIMREKVCCKKIFIRAKLMFEMKFWPKMNTYTTCTVYTLLHFRECLDGSWALNRSKLLPCISVRCVGRFGCVRWVGIGRTITMYWNYFWWGRRVLRRRLKWTPKRSEHDQSYHKQHILRRRQWSVRTFDPHCVWTWKMQNELHKVIYR